jgi:(R,R)-butanediol dehydrogenase/meso-butanediol dehydrogenase/diacetyl reductase
VKPGGFIALVAIYGAFPKFDAVALTRREITITGSRAYRHCYPEVIEALASGRLSCEGLVTAVVDVNLPLACTMDVLTRVAQLEHVKEQGFEALLKEPEKHIKILIKSSSK